ncbi:MAG: transcriptional regulator [Rhizobiaceae bacterium]
MNDNGVQQPVYIIVGQVWQQKGGEAERVHVLLTAADDDTAVRKSLEALASEGYVEADLDQIGEITDMPDEEPHASAYQGALEGEVAIVTLGSPDIEL